MPKEFFIKHILIHKDKMYRFALSYLSDTEDAKDVVQEVMLKIWEKHRSFGEIKNTEAWCMTLTRNKSLDRIKSFAYKKRSSLSEHNGGVSDATPFDTLASKENKRRLMNLIDTLPLKQKEVLNLRDIEEYSYKEIVDILQMDMNQVKVNLFRARQALKEKLNEYYAYGRE